MMLIPIGLFLFVGCVMLALFGLWIFALIDVVKREFPDPNAKLIWVLVIVLTHALGAILYLAIGRSQGRLPGYMNDLKLLLPSLG